MGKRDLMKILTRTRGGASGCPVCRDKEVCAKVDDMIKALKEEDANYGYPAAGLLRALGEIMPDHRVSKWKLNKHLRECRTGWNG